MLIHHELIEQLLSDVSEGRVPEVVSQRRSLNYVRVNTA
jgi:hypothetical protein